MKPALAKYNLIEPQLSSHQVLGNLDGESPPENRAWGVLSALGNEQIWQRLASIAFTGSRVISNVTWSSWEKDSHQINPPVS